MGQLRRESGLKTRNWIYVPSEKDRCRKPAPRFALLEALLAKKAISKWREFERGRERIRGEIEVGLFGVIERACMGKRIAKKVVKDQGSNGLIIGRRKHNVRRTMRIQTFAEFMHG